MDSKMYPVGNGQAVERYISGVLVKFGRSLTLRTRITLAQANAGGTLVAALPGVQWQVLDWMMIARGGNAAGGTSLNIRGTVSGSTIQIAASAVAGLTQSAVLRAGATNGAVLADGASFVALDANTAITYGAVGTLTTSTGFDITITYVANQAA